MSTTNTPLSRRLRDETRHRHDAIESLAFYRALIEDRLPRQSMVSYLRGLSVVHAVLETALRRTVGDAFGPWRGVGRLDDLLATLDASGAAGLPDVPHAVDAAIAWADAVLLGSRQPTTLLGTYYLLEGSQLGGQVLRRNVATALGVSESGVTYLHDAGVALEQRWASFQRDLDALALTEDDALALISSVNAAYDGIEALAEAAFPFDEADLRHRVTAINPEAGRHAMPQSDVEIARALRCAGVAWRRFPYLALRFGERGRRFTNSDGCWLVSLFDHDEASVVRNLVWLRGVLASRGLPTVILEGHLRVIDEDVALDDPQRAQRATGFRAAIDHFRTEREAHLSAGDVHVLAQHWQRRLDASPGTTVPGAAELLIASRLDTAAGIETAWEQTRDWFCDPTRFSEGWISTVHGLGEALEGAVAVRR